MKYQEVPILIFLIICLSMTSCIVPVNTYMESARTLGKGNVEVTGSYSNNGEFSISGPSNNNYGARLGVGLNKKVDLKLRYIRLVPDVVDEDTPEAVNYLALIPKFSIKEKYIAASMPIGLYFSNLQGDSSDLWFISPRIVYTHPFPKDKVEISLSSKVDFYFDEGYDPSIGFNLGGGFSSDLTKWAIRPEIGVLFYSSKEGGNGTAFMIGIGGSIILGHH